MNHTQYRWPNLRTKGPATRLADKQGRWQVFTLMECLRVMCCQSTVGNCSLEAWGC